MYIYIIQSYDNLCCVFNPYVVAFTKEEDAEGQVRLYNDLEDNMLYGYKKVWLNNPGNGLLKE